MSLMSHKSINELERFAEENLEGADLDLIRELVAYNEFQVKSKIDPLILENQQKIDGLPYWKFTELTVYYPFKNHKDLLKQSLEK